MIHDSPRPSPQRRRRAATTERILDAAMQLLAEEGLAGLTTPRLAESLDYTAGALYRYFPSKDALLAELERRVVMDIAARVEDALASALPCAPAPAAALVPLLVVTRLYAALPHTMPERFSLVSQSIAHSRRLEVPEGAPRVGEVLMPLLDRVAGLASAAADAGALCEGDGAERALLLWSALHGAVLMTHLQGIDPAFTDRDRLAERIAHDLFTAWGARPEHLAAARAALDGDA